ncbi:hypothetical protein WJX77_012105 [Trebouxia sp. C0004]
MFARCWRQREKQVHPSGAASGKSTFARGNELDLQKNGKPAGRLLLLNINALVPGTMPARVEVVGAQEGAILPEDDGNGLSQELFVYDTVIRLSPFQDTWRRRAQAVVGAQWVAFVSLFVNAMLTVLMHYTSAKK